MFKKTDEAVNFFKSNNLLIEFAESEKSTASSVDAAKAIKCELNEIAKSIIFDFNDKPILVLVEGGKKVDIKKLESILKGKVKIADPYFVKEKTGFLPGEVTPINKNIKTIIDSNIANHPYIWVSAGSKNTVAKIKTGGLASALCAEILSVSTEN